MVAGECGVPGVTALGPVVEECSIHFVPVTTLCLKTGASTVRARGSSIVPVTLRPALILMVRDICLEKTYLTYDLRNFLNTFLEVCLT